VEEFQTEHGIFTNNKITGQTAQQVYGEWLLNKDKPTPKSELEIIRDTQSQIVLSLVMGGLM